jgi:hypothetical protein
MCVYGYAIWDNECPEIYSENGTNRFFGISVIKNKKFRRY